MTIIGFVIKVRRRVSLVEQVMNTLQEHISPPDFSGVHIVDICCVMFCRSLFVLFLLVIVLYVLQQSLIHNKTLSWNFHIQLRLRILDCLFISPSAPLRSLLYLKTFLKE
jgi:hypothetical protein